MDIIQSHRHDVEKSWRNVGRHSRMMSMFH